MPRSVQISIFGWGVLWKVKTQSAKIGPNFNLGVVLESQNPKCQDLSKFQFFGGRGALESQNPKCQDLSKFQFLVGGCSGKSKPKVPRSVQISIFGWGVVWKVKTQSAKIGPNFNLGVVLESQNPKCQDLSKFQFFGGRGVLESQNPKCQDLSKFQFLVGGCSGKSKPKVPRLVQISIFGWGVVWKVKTQSAKIGPNFNLGVVLESQNPKCQDLSKFQFFGGRGVLESQNPKCQDLSKFQFLVGGCSGKSKPKVPRLVQISIFGWGWFGKSKPKVPRLVQISIWGVFLKVKTQSAKICPNFNFLGGGGFWKVKTQSAKICPNFNFLGGECSEPNSRTGCSVQFGQKFLEA